jgi:hypothetical protein
VPLKIRLARTVQMTCIDLDEIAEKPCAPAARPEAWRRRLQAPDSSGSPVAVESEVFRVPTRPATVGQIGGLLRVTLRSSGEVLALPPASRQC